MILFCFHFQEHYLFVKLFRFIVGNVSTDPGDLWLPVNISSAAYNIANIS